MKTRLYSAIARKYGLTTFIPCREVDGAVAGSMDFLDYGISGGQAIGGVFSPSFNVVGNADWIGTGAATTSSPITATNALLPSATNSFILMFAIKAQSHPNYTNGEFSVGNPAASVIEYASVSVTEGTVTIKDLLSNTTTITTTEAAGGSVKAVLIRCDRPTGLVQVWSGRVGGIVGETGRGNLIDDGVSNIITSGYYMQDVDELHPILAWQYSGAAAPAVTDAEAVQALNVLYNSSRFGRQVPDWDAIPESWTNTALRDELLI